YVDDGGLDVLLTGGWLRVAKDAIDPIARSYRFGFERKSGQQAWLYHYRITERNGKVSPLELPAEMLAGKGESAIKRLRKSGVRIVRRDAVPKALIGFLDFPPKHEIVRMPQVGFFEVDGHYIYVRSNETLLPPALRRSKDIAYAADNASDPDQYGCQIKGT